MDLYFYDCLFTRPMKTTLTKYIIGFAASLLLTGTAYFLAVYAQFPPLATTTVAILALACLQFFVQMYYFLHIDLRPSSRTKLLTLGFAVVIVAILVSGSVWIMSSLNNRMMPSTDEMNQYMNRQPGI
ncbi:hypothetical protein BH11PAT2_BH11PAT2_02050 [soil metagenome]